MQLEVGKKYRTRDGNTILEVIEIEELFGYSYPVLCRTVETTVPEEWAVDQIRYKEDGRAYHHAEDPEDLVEEVTD